VCVCLTLCTSVRVRVRCPSTALQFFNVWSKVFGVTGVSRCLCVSLCKNWASITLLHWKLRRISFLMYVFPTSGNSRDARDKKNTNLCRKKKSSTRVMEGKNTNVELTNNACNTIPKNDNIKSPNCDTKIMILAKLYKMTDNICKENVTTLQQLQTHKTMLFSKTVLHEIQFEKLWYV